MAAKKADTEHLTQTAGVSADAEKIEVFPAGPRDALIDPSPDDIVPGIDSKGYHAGLVRQPAELVGVNGQAQGFRSIADQPSAFAKNDLKAMKAAHNRRDAKLESEEVGPNPAPSGSFVPGVGFVSVEPEEAPPARARARTAPAPAPEGVTPAEATAEIVDEAKAP